MPVKVAQITLSMGTGGIEKLIISLVRAINKEQVQFFLYCLDSGGELLKEAELLGVQIKIFNRRPGLDWRLIVHLAKTLRKDGIQVVHTHNEAAHFYGCLAARLAGIPVIINTEHSRHYIQGHWRRQLEKKLLSMLTSKIVTVSEELNQLSIAADKITTGKLETIVNGVDVASFNNVDQNVIATLQQSLGVSEITPVISIVARLHPIKNHKLLLKAMDIVRVNIPDIQLLIVGDGDESDVLRLLTKKLNLGSSVKFLGNRSDVPEILMLSHGLVLCSLTEGLPLILLESMAARVPIVITNSANRCGLIVNNESGIVVGDTAEELAFGIETVIRNSDAASIVAEKAYHLVNDDYSIEKTAEKYLNLYKQQGFVQC